MSEVAKTILQQRIIIWALVLVIFVLLVIITSLTLRLKEKDLDGKIARGRRTAKRMEQRPRRIEVVSASAANMAVAFDDLSRKLNGMTEGLDDE